MRSPHFIVNTFAAGGRLLRQWAERESTLRSHFPAMSVAYLNTDHTASDAIAAAAATGHSLIVGVGGDGTHHLLVNAMVAAGVLDRLTYAPLPLGTGNDWVRTLGTPRKLPDWIAHLKRGQIIDYPIGRVRVGGGPPRFFINALGAAYDARVVRGFNEMGLSHRLGYPLATALLLPAYSPPCVRLAYGDEVVEDHFHTINVGIGRYSGGGMCLLPQADPSLPGLALTFARRLPIWRIALSSWRFYTKTIGKVPGVTLTRTPKLTATVLSGDLEVEADGEYIGKGNLIVDLYSSPFKVIA